MHQSSNEMQVRPKHTVSAWPPPTKDAVIIVTAPTMLGTSGTLILPRASALRSSQTAMQPAMITTPRKACLRKSRLARTTTPRLGPTLVAVGRIRPARLGFFPWPRGAGRGSRRLDGVVVIRFVSGPASDLEELAFLYLEDGVDALDMLLGEDLELLLCACTLVLTDISVLDHVVDLFLGRSEERRVGKECR